MDITYHYPPELFNLMIDTIPRLCRSKLNLLLFFRGSGIRRSDLADLEAQVDRDKDSINKFQITRTVLQRLNERGEPALRERRELLRRVVEFEDFSACWPSDELKAKGLVAEIRRIVDVKDSFTRMRKELDEERRRHIEAKQRETKAAHERREKINAIHKDLCALFSVSEPQKRGLLLEDVINRLFDTSGILIRESFRRRGEVGQGIIEQIDGVVELDGEIYLVEMKWLKEKAGVEDVSQHLVRVFNRESCRGIFISATEPTEAALQIYKESLGQMVAFICLVQEIVMLLERFGDLKQFLRRKLHATVVDKNPFLRIMQ